MKMNVSMSLVVLLVFVVQLSCLLKPQAPKDLFVARDTLPEALDIIANPLPSQSQLSTLLAKETKGRVAVGVIDNGVDYRHPDLYKQMRFEFSGDKIVGIGKDVMGQDTWPHPSNIDPALFALSADAIVDNRIKGNDGDPLTWMNEVQKAFAEKLVGAIKNDSALKSTLFYEMVNVDSFVVFVALDLIKEFEDERTVYELARKKGLLIDLKNIDSTDITAVVDAYDIEIVRKPRAWLALSGGRPSFHLLKKLVGYDLVIGHIEQVLYSLSSEFDLKRRMDNYQKLIEGYSRSKSPGVGSRLASIWADHRFQERNSNSIIGFIEGLCEFLPKTTKKALHTAKDAERIGLVRNALIGQIKATDALVERFKEELSFEEKKTLRKSRENGMRIAKFFDTFTGERPYLAKYFDCSEDLKDFFINDSGLNQFNLVQSHPYKAGTEVHGTHVSGIIARQSKKIDIVPVRVITSNMAVVPDRAEKIRKSFDLGFQAWVAKPVVIEAINQLAEDRFKQPFTTTELQGMMKEFLDDNFFSLYLDFTFFEEIKEAVRFVGEAKVKVANVSLGTNFEKAIFDPSERADEKNKENFIHFLIYEYFKFNIAETLDRYASKTLFVIASGNDNAWLDGKSRSGLPCDLSSPMIARIEKEKGVSEIVPNNRIENILCVGSIDRNDEKSSFMNIPLTSVPFVLSYGEAILSPVAGNTCDGSEQEVGNELGRLEGILFPSTILMNIDNKYDDDLIAYYRTMGWLDEDDLKDLPRHKRKSAIETVGETLGEFIGRFPTNLEQALIQSRCMRDRNPRARLSGTSMATPAVAGYIAKLLVPIVNKRGLSQSDLYELGEFSPVNLIKMIKDHSPVLGDQSLINDVTKVIEIKEWKSDNKNPIIGVVDLKDIFSE